MTTDNLILESKDSVATITINRPPANSWNLVAMEKFETILDQLEKDNRIRVIVLTGAGNKCFSAGFDVTDAANANRIGPKGQDLWRRVDRFSKPIIAAMNGHALGGGLELALSCHFRIMTDVPKATVGLTELNLGIIPGWGGTQRLYRLVGKAKALEMILFSKRLSPQEALSLGLLNQLAAPDKLMDDALQFAALIAERPPLAVRSVLKAMSTGIYEGMDAGLQMELEGSRIVSSSKDSVEGFTAFLEKRKPVFKGE